MAEPATKKRKTGAGAESKGEQFSPVEIIAKKRDGGELSESEIQWFVQSFNSGAIADYQMSALLMAIYIRGMSLDETACLTLAMAQSGTTADWTGLTGPKVDKHSTGGVGDKVSLILAPLAASLGLIVPMMSGRGLGHTGGTLDKLEAIPNFSATVDSARFKAILQEVGCAIVGPTSDIAPVDKKIYALRDVTATTESLPLLCSSIMSKKLAENPDSLVLDVKTGRGAFLKKWSESVALAQAMISAGEHAGKRTVSLLTSMEQPLGNAVGNWVETREAVECLQGKGPADLRRIVLMFAAHMYTLGKGGSLSEALAIATQHLDQGKALAKFRDMVRAQGGDVSFLDQPDKFPQPAYRAEVKAQRAGIVSAIDCLEVGLTCVRLGAGRQKVDDVLDYGAGIHLHAKMGTAVQAGDKLASIFTSKPGVVEAAVARLGNAFTVSDSGSAPPLIQAVMDKKGLTEWPAYCSQHGIAP